jgi:hypothetical protein
MSLLEAVLKPRLLQLIDSKVQGKLGCSLSKPATSVRGAICLGLTIDTSRYLT